MSSKAQASHAAHSATGGGQLIASTSLDPHDIDDVIQRLHIGTLQREKLKARRSILINDDVPPLTYHEAEVLSQSETYSVTSEESYADNRPARRKISGTSSKDSGLGVDSSPQSRSGRRSPRPRPESKDQEVQTSFGKGSKYHRLQDVYAAEEGTSTQLHKGGKHGLKLFKSKKGTQVDDNQNTIPPEYPTLPSTFIVKYMGKRTTKGYGGAKYTQAPVEEVIEAVNQLPKGSDLPLVRLEVTLDGLNMTPHKRNKVKSFESVAIPIQFISYGSQDQNYPRVFCFIMVREMSARSKKLDCHVYACDSSKNARKLAGLLSLAFQVYQEKMEGKPTSFSSDIYRSIDDDDDDLKSSYDV